MYSSLFSSAAVGALLCVSLATVVGAAIEVERVQNCSPRFVVPEKDLGFFINYTGYQPAINGEGEVFFKDQIARKALSMIDEAQQHILLSLFLFDSFYAGTNVEMDIVGTIADALVRKKSAHPELQIAVILDPSHKAYGRRVSPVEQRFRANGIDIFYSDLLSGLKRASLLGVRESLGHVNRGLNRLTFNAWGNLGAALFSRARLPGRFDGDPVTLETVYNVFLMKANHRKLLVVDAADGRYEALITSANPHNASARHINTAVTAKGAPARYVFNVLRRDMMHSAGLGRRYAHWHDAADRAYRRAFFQTSFPELELPAAGRGPQDGDGHTRVRIVTESAIRDSILALLAGVDAGDEVRIQMFYLSFPPIVDAILDAGRRTAHPIRLLLDANKDSFNREKDGTPNRQVARYLLQHGGDGIAVRWYATHGEQNHAKIMTVTNPDKGTYTLTTGSCNWTGRNIDGVNMEANIVVEAAPRMTREFNRYFDLFWSHSDGTVYSLDYETYRDQTASDRKWRLGEKPFYYSLF